MSASVRLAAPPGHSWMYDGKNSHVVDLARGPFLVPTRIYGGIVGGHPYAFGGPPNEEYRFATCGVGIYPRDGEGEPCSACVSAVARYARSDR